MHDSLFLLHIAKVLPDEAMNFIVNAPLLSLKTFFPYIILKKDAWFLKLLQLPNIRIEEEFEFQFQLWKEKKNPVFSKLKQNYLQTLESPLSPIQKINKEVDSEEDSFASYSSTEIDTLSDLYASDSPIYSRLTPETFFEGKKRIFLFNYIR